MRKATKLETFFNGGVSDTTAPSVVITSGASGIATGAFSVTITFSEAVVGFVLGDITTSANAGAGTFAGSGAVYTAVITPTADGPVTVDIAAGVCTDAAGNANTAAAQFSIFYAAFRYFFDSHESSLYQDVAGTTPALADGDQVGLLTDLSGNARHLKQYGADNTRPIVKNNIQNSRRVVRSDGLNDYIRTDAFTSSQPVQIIFGFINRGLTSGYNSLHYGYTLRTTNTGVDLQIYATNPLSSGYTPSANEAVMVTEYYNTSSSTLQINQNAPTSGNVGAGSPGYMTVFSTNGSAPTAIDMMFLVAPVNVLSAPNLALLQDALNAKWQVFF